MFSILLFCLLATSALAEDCFLPGECSSSLFVDLSVATSREHCHQSCQANIDCQYFTYYDNDIGVDDQCFLFANCITFTNDSCNNCFSGERDCANLQCFVKGQCRGTVLGGQHAETPNECLDACEAMEECNWFTFDEDDYQCAFLSTCEEVDEDCKSCFSGQAECQSVPEATKILLVTGFPLDVPSEVIDLSTIDTTCQTPADYPLDIYGAVGLVYGDEPMVCGGREPYTTECNIYDHDSNAWVRASASLLQARTWASAVRLSYDEYWIMGGDDAEDRPSSSTEIFKDGTFRAGPELPESMAGHCALRINSSHIFIASASSWNAQNETSFISSNTYLYNLKTSEWQNLPPLNPPRSLASCGFVRNSVTGNIDVVVAGGYTNGDFLDSTVILSMNSLQWRFGAYLPYPLSEADVVQFRHDFMLTGGYNIDGVVLNIIYHFDASDYQWKEKGQKLKSARSDHLAFAVPENWTSCT